MAVDTHGWQTGRSLLDCHKFMLENHVACDVTFKFPTPGGSSVSLAAHAYMLRCRSAVFDAMLSGNFREKSEDVTVTDIEPDVFMEVLRYMYYDEANLTCHNVLHVLFAAKKYLLEELASRCDRFLKAEMSEDNVCTILTHSVRYGEKPLIEDCVDIISQHAGSVVKSEDFLELSQEALFIVLRNDEFALPNELDILEACLEWSKSQNGDGDARTILGDAFYQIRFLMLTPDDILRVKEDEPTILSDKETVWLLQRLIRNDKSKVTELSMGQYNFNNRHVLPKKFSRNRFELTAAQDINAWVCNHRGPDRISFKCNKAIWFRGITLYGGHKKNDKHSVTMKLLKGEVTLSTTTVNIVSDGTDTPIEVLCTKAVCLESAELYTIEADLSGPSTFYGTDGEAEITCDDITITYSTFDGKNNHSCVDHGQIPQIILSPSWDV